MFDIGWGELLLLACLALIVIGPKDLPRLMRKAGAAWGRLRNTMTIWRHNLSLMDDEISQSLDVLPKEKQNGKRTNKDS